MFSIPLGLLLVLVWAVTLIAGVAMTPPSHWLVQEYGDIAAAQLIVSTAAFMLMALFPLVAAATNVIASIRQPNSVRRYPQLDAD